MISGFDGNDTISVAAAYTGPTLIYGGNGNDNITGGGGNDFIDGGSGSNFASPSGGQDTIGNVQGVSVQGTPGDDRIVIGWKSDHDDDQADLVSPFPVHHDFMVLHLNDRVFEMEYTPHQNGAKPTVVVNAGDGNDTVVMSDDGAGQHWNAEFHGGAGNDILIGSSQLFDRNRSTSLYGDAGDDILIGGAGPTLFVGGQGNDRLLGGTGLSWVLKDATSADVFVPGTGKSTILPLTMTLAEATKQFNALSSPTVTITGHAATTVGALESYSFLLKGLTDAEFAAGSKLTIDWGDGSAQSTVVKGKGASLISHKFKTAGVHYITAKVTSSTGVTGDTIVFAVTVDVK